MTRVTDPAVLAELLAEETRRAIAKRDLDTALPRVVELALASGLGDHGGVTQRFGIAEFETAAPTDQLVTEADRFQYDLIEGPCVEASYEDGAIVSLDVANDPRWPRWGPAARGLGIHSVLSISLYTSRNSMGAMNLYSSVARDYTKHELVLANLIGAHASVAIAHFRGAEHLWKAIDARHQVGMAQGILRHQYNLTIEQSLALLHRVSADRNIKLHVLAGQVVAANSGGPLAATPEHRIL